jgi:hypothetical protein
LAAAIAGKQNTITLTTTGTSGAATLSGATLNIPQYSGGSGNDSSIVYYQLAADSSYALAIHSNRSIHLSSDTLKIIGTKLSGNGYVLMTGSTPSYVPIIPITGGGTNNNALDVSVGNLFTGDGSKITSIAHGTTGQTITWNGSALSWTNANAWNTTGNTLPNFPDTSVYFGSNNNAPLWLKANGKRVGRLDSTGIFSINLFKQNGQDSLAFYIAPTYIRCTSPSGNKYFSMSGTASFGTTAGASDVGITAGYVQALNTSVSSSFQVSSGVQNFRIAGSTGAFIGLSRYGIADVGGWGVGAGSNDLMGRINSATSATTGTQFMRIFGTTQNVSIGTSTTDPLSSLFTVNSEIVAKSDGISIGAGQYKVSIPAPKMTSSQRDSILTGVATWTLAGGTGYTNGTYTNVLFTGGTGAGFHATLAVTAGVCSFNFGNITDAGGYYSIGDVLTASIPGGSGFQITVTGLTSTVAGGQIYNTTTNAINVFNGLNFTGDFIVSSASTLTLKYGGDYVFTGSTATYTLPAISSSILGSQNSIKIKNRGSGTITLNTATGSTLYTTSAVSTINIIAGAACELMPDGSYNLVMINQ